MYPRLSDLFQDVFGFSLPFPIYSFGAMMALGVILGMWVAQRELDRMHRDGRISGIRLRAKRGGKKGRSGAPVVSPSALMGTVTVLVVVCGVTGAKIFHILENLETFVSDPAGMLFASGGLTFYGGLIAAGVAVTLYVRKKGVSGAAFADALAPSLMLAYGVGRIGCHLAGDGDWGIPADMAAKPGWIPVWLWAETYPNNILGIQLPESGVYPTSIYEFLMAMALFGVLWALRKHPYRNGWLFSWYLVFNGAERFLIEQIRVNNTFDVFGLTVTQAEVISLVALLLGSAGLVYTSKRREESAPPDLASSVPGAPASRATRAPRIIRRD